MKETGCTADLPDLPSAVQVLEGADGAKVEDFQAYHKAMVHTSPLLYDFDFDGIRDIVLATYDGDILFFKDTVSSFIV